MAAMEADFDVDDIEIDNNDILRLQALIRGFLTRQHLTAAKNEFQEIFNEVEGGESKLYVAWEKDTLCMPRIRKERRRNKKDDYTQLFLKSRSEKGEIVDNTVENDIIKTTTNEDDRVPVMVSCDKDVDDKRESHDSHVTEEKSDKCCHIETQTSFYESKSDNSDLNMRSDVSMFASCPGQLDNHAAFVTSKSVPSRNKDFIFEDKKLRAFNEDDSIPTKDSGLGPAVSGIQDPLVLLENHEDELKQEMSSITHHETDPQIDGSTREAADHNTGLVGKGQGQSPKSTVQGRHMSNLHTSSLQESADPFTSRVQDVTDTFTSRVQDSTTLTNVSSIWDSYSSIPASPMRQPQRLIQNRQQSPSRGNGPDAFEPSQKPQSKDTEELRKIRANIAMELLWVQQAISSRKNYLKLKSQMRVPPSS